MVSFVNFEVSFSDILVQTLYIQHILGNSQLLPFIHLDWMNMHISMAIYSVVLDEIFKIQFEFPIQNKSIKATGIWC